MKLFGRFGKSLRRQTNRFSRRPLPMSSVLQRAVIESLEPRQLLTALTANIATANFKFDTSSDIEIPDAGGTWTPTSTGVWSGSSTNGYAYSTTQSLTLQLTGDTSGNVAAGDYFLSFTALVLNENTWTAWVEKLPKQAP